MLNFCFNFRNDVAKMKTLGGCTCLLWSQFSSATHSCLFVTPRTAVCQASLSITNSQSLLKLMCMESLMPSNHLILYHPLLLLPSIFPSIRSFPMSCLFSSGGQSIGLSASASVLPKNIQDLFPLGLTGLISLQSKGLSGAFSNTTVWKHQTLMSFTLIHDSGRLFSLPIPTLFK